MLEQCVFPELKEPFATALRQAVVHILENYNPLAIIASGSIIHGEGHANSDLDIYVIFEGDYRKLEHKYFNDVQCQIFCNPPQRMPQYFVEERTRLDGGNSTAHMVANGFVILNCDSRIDDIRQQAQEVLQLPPLHDEGSLQRLRYHAVDSLENVLDLRESDPDMAQMLIGEVVPIMLRYYFLKQKKYIPRHKDILKHVRNADPELAQLLHRLYTSDNDARYDILLEIADKTIETRTFFEYEWSNKV
jgi:hypothetical protein